MAEPTTQPAPSSPDGPPPLPGRRRSAWWVEAGLEAVSLSMLGVIAVGLLIHGGRREISRDLAQSWLRTHGVDAVITVDDLDASGFTGSVRLGPRNDPSFTAERIEVAYDLRAPWMAGAKLGSGLALETRALRLVRPRLKARLTDRGLDLGPLQPLVNDLLKAPRRSGPGGPAILVENARLDLRTPGGLVRLTGDASLDNGQLLRLDGRLGRARYVTDQLLVEARGALLTARKRGDRLALTARFDLDALVAETVELEDAQGQIDAEIAYPDLTTRSARGPAELRAMIKAGSTRTAAIRSDRAAASLALIGTLDGSLTQPRFSGRMVGEAHGQALQAPGLEAREIGLGLDFDQVVAERLDGRIAARGRGQVQAEAGQALAGGIALREAAGQLQLSDLSLAAEPDGLRASGPLALQLGASRAARGSLALTSLVVEARGRTDGLLRRPDLNLTGSAEADSGLSRPDAERLAGALPDPADARAATQALQTFALKAPGLSLTLGDGRTRLGLSRPISLNAAPGVRASLAAPRGPLLDAADGRMHGNLVASLSGGGLPSLDLEVPDWRWDGLVLSAPLALAGDQFDIAPLQGLAGRVEGLAKVSGSRATFTLARCQPLTAVRLRMGDTPLSHPGATLCPGSGPLLTVEGGLWTTAARFSDLTVSLDEAQAAVEGGAGSLSADNAGGPMRAEVRLDQGTLRDVAEGRRFNPIRTTGRLALSNGLWTGGLDAATPLGQPLGRITLRHDVAQARGRAELDASRLAFQPDGLQPGELSPLAAGARQATGPASLTGLFVWDADGMRSSGRLSVGPLDFTSPIGVVADLQGKIDFTSLAPLVSAPDQRLRVSRIDAFVPLDGFAAAFRLGSEALQIDSAVFEAAKGRVSIEPTEVSLEPGRPIRGVIVVQHMDLGELIAASSLVEKIQLDAVVDGRLPFELGPKGFRLLEGRITAIQPGRLALSRAALSGVQAGVQAPGGDSPGAPAPAAAPVNAIQDFAYQAMENLSFTTLEASVNSTDQGRLAILFHIKGEHDPKVAEKARIGLLDLLRGKAFNKRIALPARTPVDLTLDTSLNLDDLLAAWRRAYRGEDPNETRSDPVQP
ncbi:intermembrane phospholipid transport protein YdbH family protein [Caulobacter henricii]|nr:YdbH domain-containing protein [Caulobacter henricii]